MTLKGQMALAIVRAILRNPEKFSLGLGQAACSFDKYWRGTKISGYEEDYVPGIEYWSRLGNIERFPKDCIPWCDIQELLPEDFAERINSLDTSPEE